MGNAKQKAVTLVEAVVAMAIIVIVSASAYFTINYVITVQHNIAVKNFFINESSNIAFCYYEQESGFTESMRILTGKDCYVYGEDSCIYYSKDFEYCEQEKGTYKVFLDFENNKLTIKSFNVNDLNSIYEIEVANG